jgi:hypothetical protein
MHRLTANEKKTPVDPDEEPDFYKMNEVRSLPQDEGPPVSSSPKGHTMALLQHLGRGLLLNKATAGLISGQHPSLGDHPASSSLLEALGGYPSESNARSLISAYRGLLETSGGILGLGGTLGLSRGGTSSSSTGYTALLGTSELPVNLAGSRVLSDAFSGSVQLQRAQLIAARYSMELELERIREQERCLAGLATLGPNSQLAAASLRLSAHVGPAGLSTIRAPLDVAQALSSAALEGLAHRQRLAAGLRPPSSYASETSQSCAERPSSRAKSSPKK